MVEKKELKCIDALREVLSQNVNPGFYSLNGYKEEAVCLQRSDDGWEVYLGERNNRYNLAKFDTVVEASVITIVGASVIMVVGTSGIIVVGGTMQFSPSCL